MDSGEMVVRAVVDRVAAREGVDPVSLDPPLHAAIDTDALSTLFGSQETDGETVVQFTYQGYRITVGGPESIRVSDPIQEPDTAL
ncbi:HalOD1 output domain-containing protein [Halomicroarcula sp. GCM10025709]|uniref:HalOD1 output domain-containing protein n=1 Tax=Haloarcula TaxID=2237 RepID=UPI0024C39C23|nr:HalOD1 output domain-containing protein [Halomicroarcula sp. YJ-61-S]